MSPRSLGGRLFLAIGVVAALAFALGLWLVDRALRLEVRERVVVVQPRHGPAQREVAREVSEAPGPDGPAAVRRRVAGALALVVLSAALATAWLVRRIVRPVAALHAASERLAAGDRTARVEAGGPEGRRGDELTALGHAFNRMAERLDAVDRQRRDLTNDVAHELRTPLTNLRCHLEALADGVTPFTPAAAHALLDDVGHLQRMVDDLADLARADAGQLTLTIDAVDLAAVAAVIAREMRPRLDEAGVTLQLDLPAVLPHLRADAARLTQVLHNLFDNAVTHTPRGGTIRLTATTQPASVRIVVADTGSGIPADHLTRVFERFHRVDASRARATGGAGLGLAIVRQLVGLHGGRVHAASPPGGGASLIVDWPIFIESSQPAGQMGA